ncbi:hypothetical protein ACHAXA_000162 [Cyclostephanos tholiformis]|uniref:Sodium/calcium exchanger membrane region domain-containing protein n=1 Tax=Cyclostephanos tholiformis TaxID=382380 RepID=A0ABD3SC50_9STRA
MDPSSTSSAASCIVQAIIALTSLWAQGMITESRLVPAIDALAHMHSVPDDVSGATLIAAGASMPELLCTLVSLFVTHSSLGLGTIVGSEVFNLLIISAGSVYASPTQMGGDGSGGGDGNSGRRELRLNRRSVLRDAGFYALSIALLYLALCDGREVYVVDGEIVEADSSSSVVDDDVAARDEVEEKRRVFVQFWKALLLSMWYVFYVAICVFDPTVLVRRLMSSWWWWGGGNGASSCRDGGGGYGGVDKVDNEDDNGRLTPYSLDGASVRRTGDDGNNDKVGFDGVVGMTTERDGKCRDVCDDERDLSYAENDDESDGVGLRYDDMFRLPRDSSRIGLGMWFVLYPLRLIMHRTIPDVGRRRGESFSSSLYHRRACLSTASCLVWLCVCSYVMVTSLENLAESLGMPDAVMGATVSAAGTSYPAYVASRMAASDGMGDRAVSNVFGSNTFNICVGLGMPWMAYIALSMGFGPYTDLEDTGVVESTAVLFGTLLIFVVLLASMDFVLVEWHANFFVGLYVLYLVYTIGDVYW